MSKRLSKKIAAQALVLCLGATLLCANVSAAQLDSTSMAGVQISESQSGEAANSQSEASGTVSVPNAGVESTAPESSADSSPESTVPDSSTSSSPESTAPDSSSSSSPESTAPDSSSSSSPESTAPDSSSSSSPESTAPDSSSSSSPESTVPDSSSSSSSESTAPDSSSSSSSESTAPDSSSSSSSESTAPDSSSSSSSESTAPDSSSSSSSESTAPDSSSDSNDESAVTDSDSEKEEATDDADSESSQEETAGQTDNAPAEDAKAAGKTGWEVIGNKWYYYENGVPAQGAKEIGGIWYGFDGSGALMTSRFTYNGKTYLPNGAGQLPGAGLYLDAATSAWYCIQSDRSIVQDQVIGFSDGARVFDTSGAMRTGFYRDKNNRLFYTNANGLVPTIGLNLIGNQWSNVTWGYFLSTDEAVWFSDGARVFDTNGALRVGYYKTPDGKLYYSNGAGIVPSGGLQVLDGSWKYIQDDYSLATNTAVKFSDGARVFDSNGAMRTGTFTSSNGKLYVTNANGVIPTVAGLHNLGNGWYFVKWDYSVAKDEAFWFADGARVFQNNGQMATNFYRAQNGKYYYAQPTGIIPQGGLRIINNAWRYIQADYSLAINGAVSFADGVRVFNNDGVMLVNTFYQAPNQKLYYVKADGLTNKPGLFYVGSLWYSQKSGDYSLAKNELIWLSDGLRYFGATGAMQFGLQSVGSDYYYFGNDGLADSGWITVNGNQYYFDPTTYKMQNPQQVKILGIDVSKFQGPIDWNAVKASGVQFVIIRVLGSTNAGPYVDQYFHTYMQGALNAGLQVGAYIYSYGTTYDYMNLEVSTALTALNAYKNSFTYPVYIDYEDPLNWDKNLTKDQHTDLIRYGMNLLAQNGYLPGFYTYYNAANTYINAQQLIDEGYEFWVAHYGASSNPWPNAGMWQYTSSGKVPGINGKVDMNYSHRDYSKMNRSVTVYDVNSGKQVTAKVKDLVPQMVQNEVGSGLGLSGNDKQKLYKAQAVAARSYLEYYLGIGQVPSVGLQAPSSEVMMSSNIVSHLGVYYNGSIINAAYGSCSGPYTNSAANMGWGNYAYLTTVESPYDYIMTGAQQFYPKVNTIGTDTMRKNIIKMVGQAQFNLYANDMSRWITSVNKDAYGNISSAVVCGVTISGGKFYENCWGLYGVNLNSWKYNGNGTWTFSTNGNGHGVGMSQYGAAAYIKKGQDWRWVLNHYYPNTSIL